MRTCGKKWRESEESSGFDVESLHPSCYLAVRNPFLPPSLPPSLVTVHNASISCLKWSSIVFIFPGPSMRIMATPSLISTGAKYLPRVERSARLNPRGEAAEEPEGGRDGGEGWRGRRVSF